MQYGRGSGEDPPTRATEKERSKALMMPYAQTLTFCQTNIWLVLNYFVIAVFLLSPSTSGNHDHKRRLPNKKTHIKFFKKLKDASIPTDVQITM
jgi:hypothetical protein